MRFAALAVSIVLAASACAGANVAGAPAQDGGRQADQAPIVREILAQVEDVPGAPRRRLSLVRYTIAPGAELPPHVHPGVQMASIVSGTLAYRIVSGTAVVQRAVGADGVAARTETLTGPADTTLGPGDAVVETGEMVHFGANRTDAPLVILAALVTDPALDLAVPPPAGSAE